MERPICYTATMENGGGLIEAIAHEALEFCPWRNADTCKSCDNVDCPRKEVINEKSNSN